MKKIWILFLLIGNFCFAKEYTLEEAIDNSLKESRGIQQSEKKLEISQLNVRKAIKSALPSVVYSGNYLQGEYDRRVSVNKRESRDQKVGYKQAITIRQPLFQGGSIFAGIQGAESYQKIAEISFLNEKINTRLKTIQTYLDIIKSKKELETFSYSEKQLQKRYQKQLAQLELRMITKTDLLKTEYELLTLQAEIEKSKNNLEIQKEKLKLQMGIPKGEDIEVQDFNVPENLSKQIDFQKDEEQALQSSLLSLLAKYQVEVAKSKQTAMAGNLLPKVNAFVTYGNLAERTNFTRSSEDTEWIGGIEVTWNIFSFGSDYDSYKMAKLEKEIEELSQKETGDNIRIRIRDAYLQLQRLDLLRESQARALEAAKLNFEMDQEKYDVGLISIIDYLDSEKQLRNAKLNYSKVVLDYYFAFEFYRSLLV